MGNRRVVLERTYSKAARASYLRAIKQKHREGKQIIYIDETLVNAGHTTPLAWLPQLQLVGIKGDSEGTKELQKIPPERGKH